MPSPPSSDCHIGPLPQALEISVQTITQLARGEDWRLTLAHQSSQHHLLWITRGQGRALLDGLRRGVGTHTALFVPAETLFALELGRQGSGLVVSFPQGGPHPLPQIPRLLRIADAQAQVELTGLIEAAQQEIRADRPLMEEALTARAALLSVWLRREILKDQHVPDRRNAAGRLSKKFAELLCQGPPGGVPVADYAGILDVTPTHLARAVKSATGKTAADLATERLVYIARDLLAGTDEPAQSISRHLGFKSAAYFTRFMQQHTGQPPSRLRGNR